MPETLNAYLAPTEIIDSGHPRVVDFARSATRDVPADPRARAVKLYYAVRDGIWYDPYLGFYRPEHFRASRVLEKGRAFCVGKAALLCALGRACGIPARIGFADVRNHLATRQMIEFMGTDVFVFHGYTEFHLEGRWVKATPAFNRELCRKHRVAPLEFDGREDSVFHAYSEDRRLFMEYVRDHGSFADVPVAEIVAGWRQAYGAERVQGWIDALETAGGASGRNFDDEEVVKISR
jgi:transglutaminase-like putative cysteine protease